MFSYEATIMTYGRR